MKPLLSDKSISGNKINLTKNGELVKTKMKPVEVLNIFSSNIGKNLKTHQYSNFDPIVQSIEYLTLSRPDPFKFFKGCLPQILLGPILNTLSHLSKQTVILKSYLKSVALFLFMKEMYTF